MAPFAGRIRDGRFAFRGRDVQLSRNLPPHAIHGTVFDRPWEIVSQADDRLVLTIDLGPDWPFRGNVTQSIELGPGGLDVTLTLRADEPMPAALGWHPWFRRSWTMGAPRRDPVGRGRAHRRRRVDVRTRGRRLADQALVPPGPRPWDDAFTEVRTPPIVRWPGALEIVLSSTAAIWVVYDERVEGVCVRTPDGAAGRDQNLAIAAGKEPAVAEPITPMTASMAWRWRDLRRRPMIATRWRRPRAFRPARRHGDPVLAGPLAAIHGAVRADHQFVRRGAVARIATTPDRQQTD